MENKMIRVDSRGRITLGELADNIKIFHARRDKHGRIILEPYQEIPLMDKKESKRRKQK